MSNPYIINKFNLVLITIFIGIFFFTFYKLTESPPTWTDEGLIVQTAHNLSEQGVYGFQIAPGEIISPSFISTSYTVTYPIATSFNLFGVSLMNARIVMGIYILLFVFAVFSVLKGKAKEELVWGLLLVGTFPPLYGHGKNVLGEVPGLFWLLLSALFIKRLCEGRSSFFNLAFLGLTFGLTLVTKPIFILVLPGMLYFLWAVYWRQGTINVKNLGVLFVSILIPIILWFSVQFDNTDGLGAIINYYGNPHSVNIFESVITNLKDFVSGPRTLFAGGVFIFWTITLLHSRYMGRKIDLFEAYLYSISFFVFILYFRNPPYYRYFFIPEILSLIFLSSNIFKYSNSTIWLKNAFRIGLGVLVVFQIYQLGFNSWVADSYSSRRFESIDSVIREIPSDTIVFFYQAPETVISLKHFNYYQYFSGTVATQFGEKNIGLIKERTDLLVVTKKDLFLKEGDMFNGYTILKEFDRYVVVSK